MLRRRDGGRPLEQGGVRGGDAGVPEGGILEDAAAGGEIDEDHAETLRVALLPLEIIEQRPMKIAEERNAFARGSRESLKIARGEIDALRIVDFAVERNPIAGRATVFGDENGQVVTLVEPFGSPEESVGRNLPAESGERKATSC